MVRYLQSCLTITINPFCPTARQRQLSRRGLVPVRPTPYQKCRDRPDLFLGLPRRQRLRQLAILGLQVWHATGMTSPAPPKLRNLLN